MARPVHHLKHWLVAHAKNDHRPHLVRAHGLALVAVLVLTLQGMAHAGPGYRTQSPAAGPAAEVAGGTTQAPHGSVLAYASGNISVGDLLSLTNAQRAAAGLPALRLDGRLNTAAGLKAANMFAENYWAHVSPSGLQPWHWFNQAGYAYRSAGENLAKDFDTSAGVMDGWMNSPGHRANILSANYSDVGFAIQNGTLVGGQTTLVVAHYGSPAGSSVAAPVVATTPRPAAAPAAVTPRPVAATTPAPTVAPTATPTPTPEPSPSASPSPAAALTTPTTPVTPSGSITEAAPAPASYLPLSPLALSRTASPANQATLVVLLALLLVYVQTHATVWRKGLARWRRRHYRLAAAAQIGAVAAAIIVVGWSGGGLVG